ncbi:MAG: hypothetical protein LLG42_02165 [Chloroflexi bacterium]|nr:hypothetical protein [Chloroflexota bacterium]
MKTDKSILFLGKEQDAHCDKALDFCLRNFTNVTAFLGKWGDRLSEEAKDWEGDYIISYLSRWVVPEALLKRARVAAFNFHPGSPDYPGIGCINFALYEESQEYGVTCHHMEPKVDTGRIIAVKRFPIFPGDCVRSLLARTHDIQLVLFYEVLGILISGNDLPVSDEKWSRPPFTRKEFNELGKITITMDDQEVSRRVRATSYGIYQPVVEIAGYTFVLKSDTEE